MSLIVALSAALGAAPAGAASTPPVDFSFGFDASRPGVAADADLHILYKDPENPDDPDGQSPPLTRVEIAAPPGTVFDGGAVPACPASDGELMTLGQAACPAESRVGGGTGSVVTTAGPPSEYVAEVTLFNYGEGIVELLEFVDGGIKVVDRARFEDESTMVLHPAVVPGFTEREFSLHYQGTPSAAERPFITTPPECPRRGSWVSRLTYTVTTGATYSASSETPCNAGEIRATLKPKRVHAGDRARLRVRLRSTEPGCVSRARVRLGGRKLRTNRAGRARIAKTFRRPGQRTLKASKRGCASGLASLDVLAAK